MKRSFLSLLLLLLINLSTWAYSFKVNGIAYNILSASTVEVTQGGDYENNHNIIIPSTVSYNGSVYSVTSISDCAFSDCRYISIIEIPESIINIGDNIFNNYDIDTIYWNTTLDPILVTHLARINFFVIGSAVEQVSPEAFEWDNILHVILKSTVPFECPYYLSDNMVVFVPDESLETYHTQKDWAKYKWQIIPVSFISQKVYHVDALPMESALNKVISDDSLVYCYSLKLDGTISGKDLQIIRQKMPNLRYLDLSEVEFVDFNQDDNSVIHNPNQSLSGFGGLNIISFIIPNNVTEIADHAFDGCNLLKDIDLENVTKFGSYSFYYCSSLDSISFGDKIESIKSFAFAGSNIRSVYIKGNGNTVLDGNAFSDCDRLNTVYIGKGVYYIGSYCFWCRGSSNLEKVVIEGNGMSSIGSKAFSGQSMTTLYIGDGVVQIDDDAFSECSNLTKLYLGRNVRNIGSNAFSWCKLLNDVNLGCIWSIGDGAFSYCRSLTSIRIPSTLSYIGSEAFAGCPITDLYLYTIEPIRIAQNAFTCWRSATLYVPETSYRNYFNHEIWGNFLYVKEFSEPYEYFYLNGDYYLDETNGRIMGEPDSDLNENAGIIVSGEEVQSLSQIELSHNGSDGASLIGGKNDFSGKVANLTAKSMKVNISVDGNRWYFFCFPFDVERDSVECTTDYVFYSYDGGKRAKDGSGWTKMNADFGSLQKGVGYIFQASRSGILTIHVGAENLSFTANNENSALHAYESSSAANASWNFLGNPYISYYDVQDLAKEYDAPIVVWNGKGYDVYKPGDDDYQLKPFEAFFVQKEAGTQYVEFLPENRITYNQATARASQRAAMRASLGTPISLDRQLVNIVLTGQDSISDRTRIVYSTKAAMDYEIGVDAAKFQADGVPQIYTLNGTTKYAINERPMGGDDIKLGYTAPKAGVYTLAVPRQDAEIEIYDNVAQAVVDFTFGDYTFESNAGTFNDRFVIHKTSGGVTAVENGFRLDGMTVTAVNGGIEVEGHVTGKVSVYSESGMLLDEITRAGRIELVDGVYIIKIAEKSVKICVGK